ncbi:hypothetical protein CBL_08469 [Carabus blaptoides fortunei]
MYETATPSVRLDFVNDGIHEIQPKCIQFPAKFSYGTAERRMLPLVLSCASTLHKMHGSSIGYAVIYLGSKLFVAGQTYVALVRSLDGVRIEELNCSELSGKKSCNIDTLAELDRMRNYPPI